MLAVVVDGVALPEAEARAMWERFSAWMEEHRGDLAGFAEQEGFVSVHPGVDGGKPILIASHHAAQQPYAPATDGSRSGPSAPRSGGSKRRHEPPRHTTPPSKKPRK
jgi:hypothetical protein